VRELSGEDAMGPWATSLSGAELDAACARIAAGIDVAGMGNLSPYVFGDRTARLLGQEPVGLPDFAGYAAGLR
ncbi:peptidase, partial [Streptomyces sp. SID7499]|nr:peptidase [Streptomyces sp. SID7499]